MNIYTHPEEIKAVSAKLNDSNYIGRKVNFDYYLLDGKYYSIWQRSCGNYPESCDAPNI